jgi:hypothetical protein
MFDFLRQFRQTAEEKQQEALSAYLDDALPSRQREAFERLLNEDADLRRELTAQRRIRQQMLQLPQRAVPRSFTLNPALYGPPRRERLAQAYPVLRAATALTAVFFFIILAANVWTWPGAGEADMVSMAEPMPAAAPLFEAASEMMEMMEETAVAEDAAIEPFTLEALPTQTARVTPEEAAVEIIVETEAEMTAAGVMANEGEVVEPEVQLAPPSDAFPAPEATADAAMLVAAEEKVGVGETAVSSLSAGQWALIGLGGLLLLLFTLTLLARRKH